MSRLVAVLFAQWPHTRLAIAAPTRVKVNNALTTTLGIIAAVLVVLVVLPLLVLGMLIILPPLGAMYYAARAYVDVLDHLELGDPRPCRHCGRYPGASRRVAPGVACGPSPGIEPDPAPTVLAHAEPGV